MFLQHGTRGWTITVGLKGDLEWTEKKIREIEEGRRSPKSSPSLKYLNELKACIEKELDTPPTYDTFRSWPKGWPKGQGKAQFWRGRP